MKAIGTLKDEHRMIERFLVVLEKLADRVEEDKKVDIQKFEEILDFIKTFADRCHHGKEEDVLYPLLEKRGIPKEGGPIGMMLIEHDEGRKHVAGLAKALEQYQKGDDTKKEITENARGYVQVLQNHIPKEDDILYPIGEQTLNPDEDRNLLEEFEKIENQRIGPGKHEEYHRLIEELEKACNTETQK